MANNILIVAVLALSSLYLVSALSCYVCESDKEGDREGCFFVGEGNNMLGPDTCPEDGDYDMCYKLTTTMELPNNGPQDRLKDNDVFSIISRGCGTKKDWVHLAKIDSGCDKNTIAGGGDQERCFCSGNECNSGSQIAAGLTLIATLTAAKLFL